MKIPNLKKNNKGLSLVELVVATVIIALVTGPIVNSFIVSGRTANRARRYTEATDVAANVFSIVKTYGLGSIIDGFTTGEEDDEVEPEPGVTTEPTQEVESEVDLNRLLDGNFTVAPDEDRRGASIYGLKNGLGEYDVRLTYDTGTGTETDFITQINAKSMAQFASMDGNYSQPYSEQDQNPDIYSDTLFTLNGEEKKAVFVGGVRKDYTRRTREIDIDISMEPSVGGDNVVKASVEYNYFYDYQRLDADGNWEQMRNVKLTAKSVQLFGDGKKVKNYTKGPNKGRNQIVTIYVMYYPDYDNVDNIVINNPDDVFCRVFLVKQWSLKKSGTDWTRLSEPELQIKEAAYRPHIRENRSINNDKDKIIQDCLLYTNAGLSLVSDLPIHGMTYSVIIDNFGQFIYRNTDPAWEKITNGYLVHREKFDRVSKIKVEVYLEGDLDRETGQPLAGVKPIYSTLESIALIGG